MPASYRIAIQPDAVTDRTGRFQSYSARWIELAAAAGIDTHEVDLYRPDWLAQLQGVDAVMWRCGPNRHQRELARRLVPAIEQALGIPCFPTWHTLWHHEDKLSQYYLLSAAGVPMPTTTVLWDRDAALAFCAVARYPFVLKLAHGYWSSNVRLVENEKEARYWIEQLFGPGVVSTGYGPTSAVRQYARRLRAAQRTLVGDSPIAPDDNHDLEQGYLYAQQLLSGNDVDTKVTIIGRRAFAFLRKSSPGDFRTTVNDDFDFDPEAIDPALLQLAFRVAQALRMENVAVDFLRDSSRHVVCEIASAYVSWPILSCPGHWRFEGDMDSAQSGVSLESLTWQPGAMRAEDAIFEDFVDRLRSVEQAAA